MSFIQAKLGLSKIHGAKVLKKDGRTFLELTDSGLYEGQTGEIYLDICLWPTPGAQYGDHRITQDLPKALRDAGQRGAILGNGKNKGDGNGKPAAARPSSPPAAAPASGASDLADEDVPF